MYTIQEQHPLEVKEEVQQLLQDHWLEVAKHKELMVLDPDWEKYQRLTDEGTMFSLVLRRDGVVVGYSANLIGPHLHYKGLTVAINDVIYVAPAYRGTAAVRLMAKTRQVAKLKGARAVLWHAKPGTSLSRLLQKAATLQDEVYLQPL